MIQLHPQAHEDGTLRERLRRGQESLGGWCSIPSSLTAEIVGMARFDWVCVDTQHGPIGLANLVPMIQALDATQTPVLVRVPANERAAISWALDLGASGVIVPMVNSADEARLAVAASRYAPLGSRSYGPTRAALRDPSFSASNANRLTVCVVQIETTEAIENVREIAAVDGIDGLFVGPSDLGLSLGTPSGDVRGEIFRTATRNVVQAARTNGLAAGMFCGTLDAAEAAREDGFTMLAIQSDVRFLRAAAVDALARLRASSTTTAAT
jgi:4-hydroxy-2-oxoheptanedioate aldolase